MLKPQELVFHLVALVILKLQFFTQKIEANLRLS